VAIVTAYVRGPISGYITGRTKYCTYPYASDVCLGSGGVHGTCRGWSNPVDIGGSGGVYLRVNYPNVSSIVTYVELRCCGTSCVDNYRRAVTVELYGRANGVCYMGSVMFGHIANPVVSNGTLYNLSSSAKKLGTAPSGSCGGCYTGAHSHMERSGGSVVAPCCGATVATSTNIYKFTWNNGIACPS
jgi:hypothetical protein